MTDPGVTYIVTIYNKARYLEGVLRAQYGADFEDREFTVAVCGPATSARSG